ncbi:MAG: ROK family protein [Longibaculum sp.]
MIYLTLDIGGSAIKYALIDDSMNFLKKGEIPAPKENMEQFLDSIYFLYEQFKEKICGIGISMPGAINPEIGFAKTGGAFSFIKDINLVDILQKRIPLPLTIGNDAKCAASAEIGYGCLRGIDDAAVIVLGTGIGGCLVIDGKVHIGKSFSSGEFSCVSTEKYCIESEDGEWCQENGIIGLLKSVQKSMNTTQFYTGKEIFEMANHNNLQVLKGIDDFCNKLVRQIFNLQAIFDPQVIAIGGGISKQPLLQEYIHKHIDRMYNYYQSHDYPLNKPKVVICQYGNDANLLGALFQLKNSMK